MSGAEDYAALAMVAERKKLHALADFAQKHRRDACLTAEIARLASMLAKESGAATPGDVSAAIALQQYASVAARRSDRLLAEKRALAPDLEQARKEAMRASGRVDAIEILASRQRAEERHRRARQTERMMIGL